MVIQTNDEILRAIDKRKLTDIFLPNMSKAFDRVMSFCFKYSQGLKAGSAA